MAKSKIMTSFLDDETPILGQTDLVPKIVSVKLTGAQVLVELLTEQEMANTPIIISSKPNQVATVPRQGYVKQVGPKFKPEDWDFNVGDRVIISGSGVIAPNYDNCHRERFFMEPHAIKGVMIEE